MQKNGSRLGNNEVFVIDFGSVISIDAGAAFGIVDGIQFVLEGNATLTIKLVDIQVL